MSECSNWLPLEDVAAGVTLAESLCDANGEVLLPAGATLNESTLGALRRRGIAFLPILRNNAEEMVADAKVQATMEVLRHRVLHLFRRCGSDGASGMVLRCVLRSRTGKGA